MIERSLSSISGHPDLGYDLPALLFSGGRVVHTNQEWHNDKKFLGRSNAIPPYNIQTETLSYRSASLTRVQIKKREQDRGQPDAYLQNPSA